LSLHELLAVPVVFELEGLGEDQQRFCSLYLLQSVLFLRKHETVEREVLRHVLVFDEAHNIFRKDQWGELSLPSKLAREVREYGEALVSATQQADVADSLIANSGTKIILRTDHPKDVDFTSKLLQVEARWVSKIPIGARDRTTRHTVLPKLPLHVPRATRRFICSTTFSPERDGTRRSTICKSTSG
jgi:DNA helicase HerA-like ATPase